MPGDACWSWLSLSFNIVLLSNWSNPNVLSDFVNTQVHHAVEVGLGVGVATMIGVGVLAAAAAIFGSGRKEKKREN